MIEDTLRGELVALAGKVVESAVLRESMTIEPDDFGKIVLANLGVRCIENPDMMVEVI